MLMVRVVHHFLIPLMVVHSTVARRPPLLSVPPLSHRSISGEEFAAWLKIRWRLRLARHTRSAMRSMRLGRLARSWQRPHASTQVARDANDPGQAHHRDG